MSERIIKLNSLFLTHTNDFLVKNVDFPLDLFVTISRVELSSDLSYAKIFVVVLPDSKRGTALRVLNKNLSALARYLGRNIKIKHLPKISFALDIQEIHGQEVDNLLNKLER